MKRIILSLAVFLFAAAALGQQGPSPGVIFGNPTPGGACLAGAGQIVSSTGTIYTCVSNVWTSTGTASFPGCTSDGSNGFKCTGSLGAGATVPPAGAPSGTVAGALLYAPTSALNALAFGAKGDERDILDCTVTASSTTMTCSDGNFTAADNSRTFLVSMGVQGVLDGTYTSGITATGAANATCTITFGGGAVGLLRLNSTNTVTAGSVIYVQPTSIGSGYVSAPTTATASNGTATCSGSLVVTSHLVVAPVITTATMVNSTTVTLGVAATTSQSGVALVSIGTDNTTALQAWLNACGTATTTAACYLPAGNYLINGLLDETASVTVYGDGVLPIIGKPGVTGYSWVMPSIPPFLYGSIIVQAKPATNGFNTTLNGNAINLRDFGIRFAPSIAFWNTGDGFAYAAPAFSNPNYSSFTRLAVWGHDGFHFAYQNMGTGELNFSFAWGGSAQNCSVCSNLTTTSLISVSNVGTASNVWVGAGSNINTWIRPQVQAYRPNTSGLTPVFLNNFYMPLHVSQGTYSMFFDPTAFVQTVIEPDAEGGGGGILPPTGRGDFNLLGNGEGATWNVLQGIATKWGSFYAQATNSALCLNPNDSNAIYACSIPPIQISGATKVDAATYLSDYVYTATATAMPANQISYSYLDFGPAYFSGNFDVQFEWNVTTGSSAGTTAADVFALCDSIQLPSNAAGGNCITLQVNTTSATAIQPFASESFGGSVYQITGGNYTIPGGNFFMDVTRNGSGITFSIYGDKQHSGVPVKASLTLHGIVNYRYLYTMGSLNAALTPTASYMSQNFIIVTP